MLFDYVIDENLLKCMFNEPMTKMQNASYFTFPSAYDELLPFSSFAARYKPVAAQ